MLSNCGISISDNSESADNSMEQIAFCYVPAAPHFFGAINQLVTLEDKFTKTQSLELNPFQHVRHLREDHHPTWHLSYEFCTLSSIWKDLVDCFQTHQASSGKWKVRSWEKCNTKKYWNKSVAARSLWLSLHCTQETLETSWGMTSTDRSLLHTQIHTYICPHTVTELRLLWNTVRESNGFKKNNGVFKSKVTVSKGSRKWTKALTVRELLTPGLKKWPQVSNDALSLELAAAVFHPKLNCQSTVQSSTISSHIWGKYTEKYCIVDELFQVRQISSENGKCVFVTELKDPFEVVFVVFFFLLWAFSDNFMLEFLLQAVDKHANTFGHGPVNSI